MGKDDKDKGSGGSSRDNKEGGSKYDVTIGKGVSVHRADCPNVAYMTATPERMLEASWIGKTEITHAVDVEVEARD